MAIASAVPSSAAAEDDRALRSSGCAASPPGKPPDVIAADGVQRAVIVVPVRAAAGATHDLVVAFHGRTNSNAQVREYFDLERHAQRPTVFVYPAGLPAGDGTRGWTDGRGASGEQRDFALFDAIILRLARLYCLDLGRMFAVGHSLGASFVNALGCARGDRLRGIATVAGGGVTPARCSGPVAALILHNPRDPVVAIADAAAVRERLIRNNGLPRSTMAGPSAEFGCVRYGGTEASDPVIWCTHQQDVTWRGRYYPHQWPRQTGALIMSFFATLP